MLRGADSVPNQAKQVGVRRLARTDMWVLPQNHEDWKLRVPELHTKAQLVQVYCGEQK